MHEGRLEGQQPLCPDAIRKMTAPHVAVPGSPGTQNLDPAIAIDYLKQGRAGTVRHALTNSFGFGGSNCSLIFGVAA